MSYQSADEAEAAFYAAFAACDIDAMRAVWGSDDVMCLHPGAIPLLSHESVMRSWEGIFTNAEKPALNVNVIRKVSGEDMAVHLVEEQLGPAGGSAAAAIVLATNVYRRSDTGWLLISHQGVLMNAASKSHSTLQ